MTSIPQGYAVAVQPFTEGMLPVGAGHVLHYELFGNPQGRPAVYLHGGPGGGLMRATAGLFDPDRWQVMLFDQRGCGKSTPHASLEANTTWDLVADMELLRIHLGWDTWLICGGSWGSTLALAYAQKYPQRVSALVLRGIFLCRRAELLWFYQEGANWLAPDKWEAFIAPIPESERDDMLGAYHQRLIGNDEQMQLSCARAWSVWEASMLSMVPDSQREQTFADPRFALAFARIESHYFVNGAFLEPDTQLLDNVAQLADIPGVIIHGRHDQVTPLRNAWDLHQAWPKSRLEIIPDAGHAVTEPGIASALVATIASLVADSQ